MQLTLAALLPNLSMTKIQKFSGGACPQTPLLGRRPWKAKGVVSLSLDGACVIVQVTTHYQQLAKDVIEPPF